ncbi:MAG: hypothetical protein PWQ25_1839 [Deferribacteres bacterium]|jgi:type IV pilus assembly protein PilA|nr:hypothetical protein [Deferribacteres bacterium]
MLIVIAILGILAVIAIPQYAKIRIRAANATTLTDIKNAKTELNAFYSEKNYYPF